MNNRQQRTLRMFHRVMQHVDSARLATRPPLLAEMRTRLEETCTRIRSLQEQQQSGSLVMNRAKVGDLKTEVRRKRVMPLVKVARPLLRFAPGEAAVWQVPHARANSRAVGRHAVALVKALKPHAKLMAHAGYTREFMQQLEADGKHLMAGDSAKGKGRSMRSRATRDLALEIKKGLETVGIIEGLMMAHAHKDDTGEAMKYSRRIQKRMGRPRPKRTETQLLQ